MRRLMSLLLVVVLPSIAPRPAGAQAGPTAAPAAPPAAALPDDDVPGVPRAIGAAATQPAAPAAKPAAPEQPLPQRFTVEMAASDAIDYVTIGPYTSRLPLRLQLVPGVYPVLASGRLNLATHLVVTGPGRIEILDPRLNYAIAGGVMIPVGVTMGAGMWALGFACGRDSGCMVANFIAWPVLGFASIITGAIFLGYASRGRLAAAVVPAGRESAARRGPRLTALGIAPTATGANLGAAFAF